jgi:hypothetical protein
MKALRATMMAKEKVGSKLAPSLVYTLQERRNGFL